MSSPVVRLTVLKPACDSLVLGCPVSSPVPLQSGSDILQQARLLKLLGLYRVNLALELLLPFALAVSSGK